MSGNAQVYTVLPNSSKTKTMFADVQSLKKNEIQRRRALRLLQVRQQCKDIANNLRERCKDVKTRQLRENEIGIREELREREMYRITLLQRKYERSMDQIGKGHKDAEVQLDPESVIAEEMRRWRYVAGKRGHLAVKRLQVEQADALQKQLDAEKHRIFVRTVENIRSSVVASLPLPERKFKRTTTQKIPLNDVKNTMDTTGSEFPATVEELPVHDIPVLKGLRSFPGSSVSMPSIGQHPPCVDQFVNKLKNRSTKSEIVLSPFNILEHKSRMCNELDEIQSETCSRSGDISKYAPSTLSAIAEVQNSSNSKEKFVTDNGNIDEYGEIKEIVRSETRTLLDVEFKMDSSSKVIAPLECYQDLGKLTLPSHSQASGDNDSVGALNAPSESQFSQLSLNDPKRIEYDPTRHWPQDVSDKESKKMTTTCSGLEDYEVSRESIENHEVEKDAESGRFQLSSPNVPDFASSKSAIEDEVFKLSRESESMETLSRREKSGLLMRSCSQESTDSFRKTASKQVLHASSQAGFTSSQPSLQYERRHENRNYISNGEDMNIENLRFGQVLSAPHRSFTRLPSVHSDVVTGRNQSHFSTVLYAIQEEMSEGEIRYPKKVGNGSEVEYKGAGSDSQQRGSLSGSRSAQYVPDRESYTDDVMKPKSPVHSGRVQLYDHANRFQHSYDPTANITVTRVHDGDTDARSQAATERAHQVHSARKSVTGTASSQYKDRGQGALRRLRLQRDYRNLLDTLGPLARQERISRAVAGIGNPIEAHVSDSRLKEFQAERQRNIATAFENVVGGGLVQHWMYASTPHESISAEQIEASQSQIQKNRPTQCMSGTGDGAYLSTKSTKEECLAPALNVGTWTLPPRSFCDLISQTNSKQDMVTSSESSIVLVPPRPMWPRGVDDELIGDSDLGFGSGDLLEDRGVEIAVKCDGERRAEEEEEEEEVENAKSKSEEVAGAQKLVVQVQKVDLDSEKVVEANSKPFARHSERTISEDESVDNSLIEDIFGNKGVVKYTTSLKENSQEKSTGDGQQDKDNVKLTASFSGVTKVSLSDKSKTEIEKGVDGQNEYLTLEVSSLPTVRYVSDLEGVLDRVRTQRRLLEETTVSELDARATSRQSRRNANRERRQRANPKKTSDSAPGTTEKAHSRRTKEGSSTLLNICEKSKTNVRRSGASPAPVVQPKPPPASAFALIAAAAAAAVKKPKVPGSACATTAASGDTRGGSFHFSTTTVSRGEKPASVTSKLLTTKGSAPVVPNIASAPVSSDGSHSSQDTLADITNEAQVKAVKHEKHPERVYKVEIAEGAPAGEIQHRSPVGRRARTHDQRRRRHRSREMRSGSVSDTSPSPPARPSVTRTPSSSPSLGRSPSPSPSPRRRHPSASASSEDDAGDGDPGAGRRGLSVAVRVDSQASVRATKRSLHPDSMRLRVSVAGEAAKGRRTPPCSRRAPRSAPSSTPRSRTTRPSPLAVPPPSHSNRNPPPRRRDGAQRVHLQSYQSSWDMGSTRGRAGGNRGRKRPKSTRRRSPARNAPSQSPSANRSKGKTRGRTGRSHGPGYYGQDSTASTTYMSPPDRMTAPRAHDVATLVELLRSNTCLTCPPQAPSSQAPCAPQPTCTQSLNAPQPRYSTPGQAKPPPPEPPPLSSCRPETSAQSNEPASHTCTGQRQTQPCDMTCLLPPPPPPLDPLLARYVARLLSMSKASVDALDVSTDETDPGDGVISARSVASQESTHEPVHLSPESSPVARPPAASSPNNTSQMDNAVQANTSTPEPSTTSNVMCPSCAVCVMCAKSGIPCPSCFCEQHRQAQQLMLPCRLPQQFQPPATCTNTLASAAAVLSAALAQATTACASLSALPTSALPPSALAASALAPSGLLQPRLSGSSILPTTVPDSALQTASPQQTTPSLHTVSQSVPQTQTSPQSVAQKHTSAMESTNTIQPCVERTTSSKVLSSSHPLDCTDYLQPPGASPGGFCVPLARAPEVWTCTMPDSPDYRGPPCARSQPTATCRPPSPPRVRSSSPSSTCGRTSTQICARVSLQQSCNRPLPLSASCSRPPLQSCNQSPSRSIQQSARGAPCGQLPTKGPPCIQGPCKSAASAQQGTKGGGTCSPIPMKGPSSSQQPSPDSICGQPLTCSPNSNSGGTGQETGACINDSKRAREAAFHAAALNVGELSERCARRIQSLARLIADVRREKDVMVMLQQGQAATSRSASPVDSRPRTPPPRSPPRSPPLSPAPPSSPTRPASCPVTPTHRPQTCPTPACPAAGARRRVQCVSEYPVPPPSPPRPQRRRRTPPRAAGSPPPVRPFGRSPPSRRGFPAGVSSSSLDSSIPSEDSPKMNLCCDFWSETPRRRRRRRSRDVSRDSRGRLRAGADAPSDVAEAAEDTEALQQLADELLCDDVSASGDGEDLEAMFHRLGLGWAAAMLRKTQEVMAISSSSSEASRIALGHASCDSALPVGERSTPAEGNLVADAAATDSGAPAFAFTGDSDLSSVGGAPLSSRELSTPNVSLVIKPRASHRQSS